MPTEPVVLIWQSLAARRASYDTLLWQTPALGLTAQAFLLTLALGAQVSPLGRAVAAALASGLALMTLQLMSKHRQHETRDAKLFEQIEDEHHFAALIGHKLHGPPPTARLTGRSPAALARRFSRTSSYRLWLTGQLAFFVVGLVVVVLVIAGGDIALKAG